MKIFIEILEALTALILAIGSVFGFLKYRKRKKKIDKKKGGKCDKEN